MNKPEDSASQPSEQDRNEARVLAMLLGESDPDEQVALEALLDNDAELQAYREQTERRLGLVDEASRDKAALETDPLRLDSERRIELEKLLAEYAKNIVEQEIAGDPVDPSTETIKEKKRKMIRFLPLASAAAVVVFAGIMARSAFEKDEGETNMAYAEEESPTSVVTIEPNDNAAQREIKYNRNGEALRSLKIGKVPLDGKVQTKTVGDITMPSIASIEESLENLPEPNVLAPLDKRLDAEAAQTSSDILNKRVTDEITAINESPQLETERQTNQLGDDSSGEFAANGFVFGGRVGVSGGFAGEETDLLARDSDRSSPVPPTPSAPPPRPASKVLLVAETEGLARQSALPAPGEEIADFADAPITDSAPAPFAQSISSRKSSDAPNENDKFGEVEEIEEEKAGRDNRRTAQFREDNFDRDEAIALNALDTSVPSDPSDPSGTGQELAFDADKKDASESRFRAKASEEAKKAPAKPTSGPISTSGKLERNLSLEGFVDASYTSEGDLKKGQSKSKGRKESSHLGEDLGTVPPPLPTTPNPEVSTVEQPFSTFSPKVSDVSFRLAKAGIKQGQWPAKATIRSEEFVNAFNYRGPRHARGENLAFGMERARHPFVKDREILRFSLGAATTKAQNASPLNLVIVLDNSASMKRVKSSGLVNKTLQGLAKHLTDADRVSLVTFAHQPKLRLDNLPGNELRSSLDSISKLIPEEGTNLEKALDLGFAAAHMRYFPKGSNRVLLLSDGAANLGERVPRALKAKVDKHRAHGIVLDCIGLSSTGYVDHMLDSISGNGRYGFLDDVSEADDAFGRKLAGILRPTVSELKIQVEFNPDRVELYRQLGFEKDQLRKQYFDEKSSGGAEFANGEAVSTLYFVKLNPKGKGDLGVLRVRYRELKTNKQRQREWKLAYDRKAPAFSHASASMRLAVHAATFAEWLADSPHGAGFVIERSIGELQAISNDLPDKASIDRLSEMMIRTQSLSR